MQTARKTRKARKFFPIFTCLRWVTGIMSKLSFSQQNFLSHGKTFFLTAKLSFSRKNFLSHSKTFFLTEKLSFSQQNFLSHGKTFFLTEKLSFSRKKFLSHSKTFFLTDRKTLKVNRKEGANVSKMAARDDNLDDLIREYFCKGFTYKEICLFL